MCAQFKAEKPSINQCIAQVHWVLLLQKKQAVKPDTYSLQLYLGLYLFSPHALMMTLQTQAQAPTFPPNSYLLPSHVPEHTYDTYEDSDERNRSDVFAELRGWRKEHNK